MKIKDSYGRDDGELPEYLPLFYSLIDINVTDSENNQNGLGYGAIKNYQETPLTSFDFEIGENSKVTITDVPLIHKRINYHVN